MITYCFFQINSLELEIEDRLAGKFRPDEIARYKDRTERLPRLWRTRLQRNYVHYVKGMYSEWFGNPHVGLDIIQYVAEVMTKLYPALRDEDSSEDNPTFVSLLY